MDVKLVRDRGIIYIYIYIWERERELCIGQREEQKIYSDRERPIERVKVVVIELGQEGESDRKRKQIMNREIVVNREREQVTKRIVQVKERKKIAKRFVHI